MANKENQSKHNTRRIYIRSQRRWQEVPEEIYQEHTRFHDTYRHRMQDRGLCCCPRNKWWVCDSDCLTCEYRNADVIASLDSPIGEEDDDLILMDTIADESVAVSELASDRIVLEQLFKRLADLMPEAADIGKLRIFAMVQREMTKRGRGKNYHSSVHAFSSKIKCGHCGSWYGSKVWHSNSQYRKTIWQCNHKFDGDERCDTPHLSDEDIQRLFLSAANKLLVSKDEVIANCREMMDLLFNTTELEAEQATLLEETQLISDMVQQTIYENAHIALDQNEYQKRYKGLTQRFETAKQRLETVMAELDRMQTQRADIEAFLESFEALPDTLTEFKLENWHSLVDYATVYSLDDIRFTFKHGQEVQA